MDTTDKISLLALVGPTASGKTRLAVDLALAFDGEVVSADSMQVYRHMDIGTATPTEEEKQGVPHHMMNILEPGEAFSVAQYVQQARQVIAEIHSRGKLPVLAGGTGLYVSSLLNHILFEENRSDPAIREELTRQAEREGALVLWEELSRIDPALAKELHPNNLGRVIRAIEAYRLTGVPMSVQRERSRREPSPYRSLVLGLSFRDRQILYDRIDRRVDAMLSNGLLEEVRALSERSSATAAQAIGYKEFFRYLSGEETLEIAAERVRQESRRYAKRQLTWFRRMENVRWLYTDDFKDYNGLKEEACEQARFFLNGAQAR
ncbi:MAG: tRNA (adenosine(37)-N6)-dimethylallyltransferase MiaA [Oscillospiraceae bacterium]|nr:tRNA (adenosine(37)-N6)-dimethylallyltransferase MiaA [Oscillospiraceae bacterium]